MGNNGISSGRNKKPEKDLEVRNMGYEFELVLVETINYTPLTWDILSDKKDKIRGYIQECPMPKSVIYKYEEELISDVELAGGAITISKDESKKFRQWFLDMIYEVM